MSRRRAGFGSGIEPTAKGGQVGGDSAGLVKCHQRRARCVGVAAACIEAAGCLQSCPCLPCLWLDRPVHRAGSSRRRAAGSGADRSRSGEILGEAPAYFKPQSRKTRSSVSRGLVCLSQFSALCALVLPTRERSIGAFGSSLGYVAAAVPKTFKLRNASAVAVKSLDSEGGRWECAGQWSARCWRHAR